MRRGFALISLSSDLWGAVSGSSRLILDADEKGTHIVSTPGDLQYVAVALCVLDDDGLALGASIPSV